MEYLGPKLAPHQVNAVGELHNGAILKGGVGTGKTRTALAYYRTHHDDQDVYVITTAKKRDSLDWEGEAAAFAISTNPELSFGGVKLTVDSWNNIGDYKEVEGAFFILDEQRLVGSGAWVKAFYKVAAQNDWIMLSATPGDTWMDYIPVFVANGFYKNRTAFIREHVVYNNFSKFPKIDHFINTGKLLDLRRRVLVEMPFARHTKRHVLNDMVEYNEELMKKAMVDRWHPYEERPIKDVGELFSVMRKIANLDPSRLGQLMKRLEQHPKLIIFYNFNYELDALRVLANSIAYPYGEWNGQKHQEIPTGSRWLYLVQYTAGAEGWNCTETDAMVLYSLNYSHKIREQCMGRIDRMDTPFIDLYYYNFMSNSWIDKAIHKAQVVKHLFSEGKAAKTLERSLQWQ